MTIETPFLFYWSFWFLCFILFAYSTFPNKNVYVGVLLLLLSVRPFSFSVQQVTIHMSEIVFVFFVLFLFMKEKFQKGDYYYTFMVGVFYTSLQLFSLVNPILFTYVSFMTLPIYMALFALFIPGSFRRKIYITWIGTFFGKTFYETILVMYHLHHEYGMYEQYMMIQLTIIFLFGFRFIKMVCCRSFSYLMNR
ncbi:YphA family membrane protein [Pseudogracilibacillus sp. ICA-222130]|uniref:YphA family membrane protein n=1 Tax=Pseudogracilibacillus sp. ICA-222130 TaxID=3134655 RepID=UPI004040BFE8